MLIGITAAILIAISAGAFVILLAAAAMTRRTVEMEPALEEQPLDRWASSAGAFSAQTTTQLRTL
ncbi:hypothetical protein [Caldilinea sp.]|jgi:hypothetical protein|uniref:hypothetical protein n=1 Tax=Caldilinea sp. TaxID=2293560 RepID=UPI0021DC3795|nr:hypothetical protein [Caldilinea sp.]GIV69588.1 MAG: hypothetical protein KatS3mg048_2450 [Caldilinea sp.]